ncbi:unnamed protein product [Mycetohabitans rhizoxinica HKI 454]|uniref:Uncharacterized protein n=1 Tax=Mycetohabitans rhizoxinica (strain DSM 19002 / CIP 109453 / HKI 454) TaxID=882378 RepID=E5AMU5_MYCRK|nr:unnamed protein product [Mycetohabitans rhizoxinica HKI 454]
MFRLFVQSLCGFMKKYYLAGRCWKTIGLEG